MQSAHESNEQAKLMAVAKVDAGRTTARQSTKIVKMSPPNETISINCGNSGMGKLEPDEKGHRLDDKSSQQHVNPFKEKKNIDEVLGATPTSKVNTATPQSIKRLLDGIVAKCNDELKKDTTSKPQAKFKLKLPIAPP